MQLEHKQEPTMSDPVSEVVSAVRQNKAHDINKYTAEQVSEWLYGEVVK